MKDCGHLPLISPWLYRLSVQRIARRAAAGDVPAVRELAAVFCTSPVAGARTAAGKGLMHLRTAEQADTICHESLLWENDALTALATGCGYLPAALPDRALWLFCTSRIGDLRHLDPEDHSPLLAAGYRAASPAVRARARGAARTNGSCTLLARALAGPGVTQHAVTWTPDEWDIVVRGLMGGKRWDELWLLSSLMPIPLAVVALAALKEAGWIPAGDDLLLWNGIVSALPDCWTYPVPAGQVPAPDRKPAGQVVRLCVSPDGTLFATGCRDGMVAVLRTASSGPAAELNTGPSSVCLLAISADNTSLVSGGEDGTVHGHSIQNQALLWSWEGREGAAVSVLSPCSGSVLIGDTGGTLQVLDARDGHLLQSLPLHPSPLTSLAHTPGGSPVACGHADGTVSVIKYEGDSSPRLFPGNGSPVRSLAFSPAGTELLVLYEQGNPVLLDIAAEKRIRTFTGLAGRTVCSAVSAEAGWFVLWSSDHMLRSWSWKEPSPATTIPFFRRSVTCCSTVPDGSLLALGFHDGKVRICRMPGIHLQQEFRAHKKTMISCALTPDGTRLVTVSWDGTSRLWRLPEGGIVRTLDVHAGGIAALAGPAGTLIATTTEDGIARILDCSDGTLIRTIDLYTPAVRAAAMSPDGRFLACAGADGSLRIWTTGDGGLAAAGDHLATSQRCCTFLPDNLSLLTGGWDGACRIFRVPDAKLLRTLYGHTSVVSCCAASRDGSLLVTGSNDTTVRLWRIAEEEAYAVLGASRSEVSAVALSPDETLLATGSADGEIRLWRLPYGTPAGELPGLSWKVTALAFTPDGSILIAGFGRGIFTLLSLQKRSLIRTVQAHTGPVTGMAVLPDGRTLVTTGGDGVCRFHPLPFTTVLAHAGLDDIAVAAAEEESAGGSTGRGEWTFLRTMLSARFHGEIGVCPPLDMAGYYDIQIVG